MGDRQVWSPDCVARDDYALFDGVHRRFQGYICRFSGIFVDI